MGNTTRRQPVNFAIPKAPAYRFMNVTNFNGLHMTDNPFITDNSTASDCLNVYVDETNTLTTRPRLELLSILSSKIDKNFKYINVYNLLDGYLIHGTLNNIPYMYKLKDDGDLKLIVGNYIPKDKCYIFEQDNKIYVLDGSKYLNIENDEIKEVEGYIPRRIVGKSNNSSGVELEDLNLLTDMYEESYIWNYNEPVVIDEHNLVNVRNEYYKKSDVITDMIYRNTILSFSSHIMITIHPGLNFQGKEYLWYWKLNNTYSQFEDHGILQAKYETADTYSDFDVHTTSIVRANKDGSVILVLHEENDDYLMDILTINKEDTAYYGYPCYTRKSWSNPFTLSDGESLMDVRPGNTDKLFIVTVRKGIYDIDKPYYFYTDNNAFEQITFTGAGANDDILNRTILNISQKEDTNLLVIDYVKTPVGSEVTYLKITDDISETNVVNMNFFPVGEDATAYEGLWKSEITGSGYLMLHKDVYVDYAFEKTEFQIFKGFADTEIFEFSTDIINFGAIEISNKYYLITHDDLYMMDAYKEFKPMYLNLDNTVNSTVDYSKDYILIKRKYTDYKNTFYRATNSNEPSIIVTRTIDVADIEYNSWYEKRNNFFKSKLNIRFENNIWFASENKLYFTRNNNPSYIPITSETVIGDDEHITGLSLVQDSVLVGYKKNNVFNITPTTFDGYVDYIVTVSKNTVGNAAFGGPIVTSLTETPVQITYDGIYALKQMTNVQSSDRISELISDNITMKWLKEKHDVIDNIQTINRAYWTYFVLKDYDVTKIYLLDNRYNTWYYWELPINTLNVFIKKDRVIVVDADGNIYKLEYSDKETEGDSSVTEYYDEVNVNTAIPWFWKSQILSLGTINHAKRLVDTTFIVSDTDLSDEYRLKYKFKVYRKMVSETSPTGTEIGGTLTYIQSVTKKTIVPKFNYIQLELSNIEGDLNNNKLRLIGLSLKYILLEGLV